MIRKLIVGLVSLVAAFSVVAQPAINGKKISDYPTTTNQPGDYFIVERYGVGDYKVPFVTLSNSIVSGITNTGGGGGLPSGSISNYMDIPLKGIFHLPSPSSHGTIGVNGRWYGGCYGPGFGSTTSNIWCMTSPDIDPSQILVRSNSCWADQMCYSTNGNWLYAVSDSGVYRFDTNLNNFSHISTLGGQTQISPAICCNNTNLFVLGHTAQGFSYFIKLGLDGSFVSSNTWTVAHYAHSCVMDPNGQVWYAATDQTGTSSRVARITTADALTYTDIQVGSFITDDCVLHNGTLYFGEEQSPVVVTISTNLQTVQTFTVAHGSWGLFTDGTNLYNCNNGQNDSIGSIDIWPNFNFSDPHYFRFDKVPQLRGQQPNEMFITPNGTVIATLWLTDEALAFRPIFSSLYAGPAITGVSNIQPNLAIAGNAQVDSLQTYTLNVGSGGATIDSSSGALQPFYNTNQASSLNLVNTNADTLAWINSHGPTNGGSLGVNVKMPGNNYAFVGADRRTGSHLYFDSTSTTNPLIEFGKRIIVGPYYMVDSNGVPPAIGVELEGTNFVGFTYRRNGTAYMNSVFQGTDFSSINSLGLLNGTYLAFVQDEVNQGFSTYFQQVPSGLFSIYTQNKTNHSAFCTQLFQCDGQIQLQPGNGNPVWIVGANLLPYPADSSETLGSGLYPWYTVYGGSIIATNTGLGHIGSGLGLTNLDGGKMPFTFGSHMIVSTNNTTHLLSIDSSSFLTNASINTNFNLADALRVANGAISTYGENRKGWPNTRTCLSTNGQLFMMLVGNGWVPDSEFNSMLTNMLSWKPLAGYSTRVGINPNFIYGQNSGLDTATYHLGDDTIWHQDYWSLDNNGQITAVNQILTSDVYSIAYRKDPSAGSFVFEMRTNGFDPNSFLQLDTNWVTIATINANNSYSVGAITYITNSAPVGTQLRARATSSGSTLIFEFGQWNSTLKSGFIVGTHAHGSSSAYYYREPMTNVAPILSQTKPTMVISTGGDDASFWSNTVSEITFWKTVYTNSDFVRSGIHWIQDSPRDHSFEFNYCYTNGIPFFNGEQASFDVWGSWNNGMLLGIYADTAHLTPFGYNIFGQLIWSWLDLVQTAQTVPTTAGSGGLFNPTNVVTYGTTTNDNSQATNFTGVGSSPGGATYYNGTNTSVVIDGSVGTITATNLNAKIAGTNVTSVGVPNGYAMLSDGSGGVGFGTVGAASQLIAPLFSSMNMAINTSDKYAPIGGGNAVTSSTTESQVQQPMPGPAGSTWKLANVYANVQTAPLSTTNITMTLRTNGVASSVVVTITGNGSNTQGNSASTSEVIPTGVLVDFDIKATANVGTMNVLWSYTLTKQ